MRILVDIGHPGHVHFFKHAIWRLQELGHRVHITARDKDVALDLLNHYGFDYKVLTAVGRNQSGLLREFITREWRLLTEIRRFKPDVMTAVGGAFIAPIGKITGVRTVVFTDTEHVVLDRYLTYPWASIIYTPDCFLGNAGPNHKRYNGFQELAYLHPNYYSPNPNSLEQIGLKPGDRFAVLRFISWGAGHDIGHSGFTPDQKSQLITELSKQGRVLLSVEGQIPDKFRQLAVQFVPESVHDLLYYASLYIGEGATMASEAALLGTPSIYVSSLAEKLGYIEILKRKGLLSTFIDGADGVTFALSLWPDLNNKYGNPKLKELLSHTIDVSDHIQKTLIGSNLNEQQT